MFFVGKKIIYLNVYDKGKKESAAGYAKCMKEKEMYRLEVFLQKLQTWQSDSYQVFLAANEEDIPLGTVKIRSGMGNACFYLPFSGDVLVIGDEKRNFRDFWGLKIQGKDDAVILGRWKETENVKEVHQAEIIKKQEWVENYADDKWQQLLRNYPKVHPFGDERVFIALEPKDFVILHSSCQKLVNNSFLLHGFYNYRHIILGFCSGIGTGERCYLGVPGTFYEREKMVAVMFGFEGFECDGPVENGKFGYYMRRVEL